MAQNVTHDILFQRVQKDLSKLNGVKTSLVASRDGYILGNSPESTLEKYAKASSAMLRIADAAISKMGWECPERIVVDYSNERLIAIRAGPKALVAVLTGPDTNLDPIQSKLEKAAEKVREII
jgi:predicted regulator of Ras-like GTPase activity (Roadblock/LC7/MglB family)